MMRWIRLGALKCLGAVVCAVLLCSAVASAEEVRGVVGSDCHHTVRSGETLYSIALHYGLAIEHLAFANGLSPDSINVAAGTSLLVPRRRVLPAAPPENGLVVNLPERGVFLFRGGRFESFYPVAIGKSGRFATPCGNFVIDSLVRNPSWLPPEWAGMEEKVVEAGPNNPLGDRWIGVSAGGIGLHSTTSPMSIGQAASHGCMRMYPSSVHELFEKVKVGWPVRIEYETAKVGCDDKGVYYLSVFPDVYGRAGARTETVKALDSVGAVYGDSDLPVLARQNGVAKEVGMYSPIRIFVDQDEYPCAVEPQYIDGQIWGPARVAESLGLSVDWDERDKVVKLSRGNIILLFPFDANYAIRAEQVPIGATVRIAGVAKMGNGGLIIPFRPMLDSFAIFSEWNADERSLTMVSLP